MSIPYYLDIGDYYRITVKDSSVAIEGSNSITLSADRWKSLVMCMANIDRAIHRFQQFGEPPDYGNHLGENYHVKVTSYCVDIRKFYYDTEWKQELPSERGIVINFKNWFKFRAVFTQIYCDFPLLAKAELCPHLTPYEHTKCRGEADEILRRFSS